MPPPNSEAETSAEACRCSSPSARLRRVARVAQAANRMLSADPVPLQSILDLIPRSAGSKAELLLRTLAAGTIFCDLIAASSEGLIAAPSRRCKCMPK
jgi:hypothetical protein